SNLAGRREKFPLTESRSPSSLPIKRPSSPSVLPSRTSFATPPASILRSAGISIWRSSFSRVRIQRPLSESGLTLREEVDTEERKKKRQKSEEKARSVFISSLRECLGAAARSRRAQGIKSMQYRTVLDERSGRS